MERWLLTYSDMITLLLALFVVLFALSTINAQKFREFELGLSKSFSGGSTRPTSSSGLLPQSNSLLSRPGAILPKALAASTRKPHATRRPRSPSLRDIAEKLDAALASAGLSSYATTSVNAQGVIVQMLADKAYFANDSATLGTIGEDVVDTIGTVLRTVPNDVEVQGYTDDVPISGGPFTSNWDLSAVRAVNVVQRLEYVDKVTAGRLRAVGFGTTHPVATNSTPSGRAANRRVDVVVLTRAVGEAGPVGAST